MEYFRELRTFRMNLLRIHARRDLEKSWRWDAHPDIMSRIALRLYAVVFLFRYLKFFAPGFLPLPSAEVCLTTRCTLRCRDCANRAQFYGSPWRQHFDYDSKTLLRDLDSLLVSVSEIGRIRLMGGETFLYPDLPEIILFLSRSEKVRTVNIVTNGTIVPSDEVFTCIKETGTTVTISDYGSLSAKKEQIVAELEKRGIEYNIDFTDGAWCDAGSHEPRGRTPKELRRLYHACGIAIYCKHIVNGRIYACSIAAHLDNLGLKPDDPAESVNLRQPAGPLRRDLKRMLSLDYISSCDHCDMPLCRPLKVAEQLKPGEYL